nr:protein LEAD-SENSITIVE 1-like [Ziziphus jujuba var. spinosa]
MLALDPLGMLLHVVSLSYAALYVATDIMPRLMTCSSSSCHYHLGASSHASLMHYTQPTHPAIHVTLPGIYAGASDSDGEVINLVRGGDHILPSSASSDTTITTGAAAGNEPTKCRVEYCSLDSFLNGGELYLYKYGISLAFFIAKTQGGTCTLGSTDPPNSVLYRARKELNGFGAYNLFNNNCEDFAIYCKTGLRSRKTIINLGRSGQIASFFGVFCAIIIFIFTFQPSKPIGVAATVYFIYSISRFVADATHCVKAYQVGLKILPFWRRGCFPVFVPQFTYLGDKEKEILRF